MTSDVKHFYHFLEMVWRITHVCNVVRLLKRGTTAAQAHTMWTVPLIQMYTQHSFNLFSKIYYSNSLYGVTGIIIFVRFSWFKTDKLFSFFGNVMSTKLVPLEIPFSYLWTAGRRIKFVDRIFYIVSLCRKSFWNWI